MRAAGLWSLLALQIDAHPLAADLNESMRHRAALALADVETVAFAEYAAEHLLVKILGDDKVIDRDDKMIEGLSDRHDFLLLSKVA